MTPSARPQRTLRELLPAAEFYPARADARVTAVTADPRRVGPTHLYVHLDEFDASGAVEAIGRGAAAVVAERLLPIVGTPLAVVGDAHETLAGLRETLDGTSLDTLVLAVGGSAGRSVTAGLLTRIARSMRRGVDQPVAVVTLNPERRDDATLPAKIVCLTNARGDGLSTDGRRRWESAEAHRAAIERSLGRLGPDVTLVANADDPDCLRIASRHGGPLVTFGEHEGADVVAIDSESFPGGQELLVASGHASGALQVSTPGAAYRSNCLAAIAAGVAAGVDLSRCLRAIEEAPAPYGMLEPVVRGQAFPVVLDRATRPDALRRALRASRPAGGGRLLATVRLSADPSVAREQLVTAIRLADRVVASGAPDGVEPLDESTTLIDDRFAAIAVTIGLADEGDAVLVAGSTPASLENDRRRVEGLLTRRLSVARSAAA